MIEQAGAGIGRGSESDKDVAEIYKNSEQSKKTDEEVSFLGNFHENCMKFLRNEKLKLNQVKKLVEEEKKKDGEFFNEVIILKKLSPSGIEPSTSSDLHRCRSTVSP